MVEESYRYVVFTLHYLAKLNHTLRGKWLKRKTNSPNEILAKAIRRNETIAEIIHKPIDLTTFDKPFFPETDTLILSDKNDL